MNKAEKEILNSDAAVFRALGDPVRLAMVQRLSSGESFTVGAVSHGFGITRQGARKHLQVLADAHLISLEAKGRDVVVQLDAKTLERAKAFIAELEAKWEKRLQSLKKLLEERE